ncbi:MAG: pilus assembly protein [Acidobacteria bacterium]|nr:pilus assembly protein [Acidobacteriota bacterium]
MRTGRNRRGNAFIEFALCLILLNLIVTGLFQYGHSLFMYTRLQNAVRAGARYASRRAYDSASATPSQAYLTAVANATAYGDPAGGGTPLVPGLSPSHVAVTIRMSTVPEAVTVAIRGYTLRTFGLSYSLQNKPRATFRYAGRFAP